MRLHERAEWARPELVVLRWMVTLAMLWLPPLAVSLGGPVAGLVVASSLIPFWLWWSAPWVGINMTPVNKGLILAVLAFHLAFAVVMLSGILA